MGLFRRLPEIDEVAVRVLDSRKPTKLILEGTVNRQEVSASYKFVSLTMRIKMLGLRYSRIIGATLEALSAESSPEPVHA